MIIDYIISITMDSHSEQSLIEECSMAAKIFGIPQHSSKLSPTVKTGLVSFTEQRASL